MAAFVDSYTSHVEKANVLGDGWLESKLMKSLCPPVGCWWHVWHLGDVKRAVGWLPFIPIMWGMVLEHGLLTACGEYGDRGEMAAHGRHQNDMWDYRFSRLKSPCFASNWLSYQSLGEDQRETLMLRVCNQNSRCEWGIEISYNPGLPDPCSPPSQWRKAEELKDPRKSHTSLPCLT